MIYWGVAGQPPGTIGGERRILYRGGYRVSRNGQRGIAHLGHAPAAFRRGRSRNGTYRTCLFPVKPQRIVHVLPRPGRARPSAPAPQNTSTLAATRALERPSCTALSYITKVTVVPSCATRACLQDRGRGNARRRRPRARRANARSTPSGTRSPVGRNDGEDAVRTVVERPPGIRKEIRAWSSPEG